MEYEKEERRGEECRRTGLGVAVDDFPGAVLRNLDVVRNNVNLAGVLDADQVLEDTVDDGLRDTSAVREGDKGRKERRGAPSFRSRR